MKTALRTMLVGALCLFASHNLIAQCEVSGIVIQNVRVSGTQTPGSCTVTFDVTFTIENNNGNKYIFIHAWTEAQYPNYFRCVNGHTTINGAVRSPKAADLGTPFMTIGIDNDVNPPQLLDQYTPDPSVPVNDVGGITREVLPDGSAIFILTDVTVTVPVTCGTPTVLIADVWSSQSARAQVVHCVSCGIQYSAGYLSVAGLVNCTTLQFNATITNNTGAPLAGYYRLFADVNGDGYFTPAIDTLVVDTTDFAVAAGPGTTTPVSATIPSANIGQDIFMVLSQTSGAASGASRVILVPSTQCAPLPVTFRSFNAKRVNASNVALDWETATETNNSGFAIQRNMSGGDWEIVGFVPSQAQNGNSSSVLRYTFSDRNNHRGISQYRIRQVDIDGRMKYSNIRAVRGDGQKGGVIVYPNPSADGRVNVLFEEKSTVREITLVDMTGRAVKQWTSYSSNLLQIDNLGSGFYTLKVVVPATGEVTTEKIIINR